jgi:hypothetical protein
MEDTEPVGVLFFNVELEIDLAWGSRCYAKLQNI